MMDFKDLKTQVSITQAAEILKLNLKPSKHQFRSACPACAKDDDRAIVITPDRGLFYCFHAKEGGDCLTLVQHVTGLDIKDAAEFLVPHTRQDHGSPQPRKEPRSEDRSVKTSKEPFDPVAFLEKLEYTAEVEELGVTKEQAQALGIGVSRGKVYCAVRYSSGTIAGFLHVAGSKIVLPKNLLPDAAPNVVKFPKRA